MFLGLNINEEDLHSVARQIYDAYDRQLSLDQLIVLYAVWYRKFAVLRTPYGKHFDDTESLAEFIDFKNLKREDAVRANASYESSESEACSEMLTHGDYQYTEDTLAKSIEKVFQDIDIGVNSDGKGYIEGGNQSIIFFRYTSKDYWKIMLSNEYLAANYLNADTKTRALYGDILLNRNDRLFRRFIRQRCSSSLAGSKGLNADKMMECRSVIHEEILCALANVNTEGKKVKKSAYDPSRGAAFTTYIWHHVLTAIDRFFAAEQNLSLHYMRQVSKYASAIEVAQNNNTPLSPDYITRRMGIANNAYDALLAAISSSRAKSIDEPTSDESTRGMEIMADMPTPEDSLEIAEKQAAVRRACDEVVNKWSEIDGGREAGQMAVTIAFLKHEYGFKDSDIAAKLKITAARVKMLYASLLQRFRKDIPHSILPYISDEDIRAARKNHLRVQTGLTDGYGNQSIIPLSNKADLDTVRDSVYDLLNGDEIVDGFTVLPAEPVERKILPDDSLFDGAVQIGDPTVFYEEDHLDDYDSSIAEYGEADSVPIPEFGAYDCSEPYDPTA